MTTRVCKKCGLKKNLEKEFSKTYQSENGYRHVCNVCRRKQVNPEKVKAAIHKYYYKKKNNNPDLFNKKMVDYRKKRKEQGNPLTYHKSLKELNRLNRRQTNKLKRIVFELKGMTCTYCGQIANQIDHVIPVTKGGLHTIKNLVPCCKSCNSSKGNKTVEEWQKTKTLYCIK